MNGKGTIYRGSNPFEKEIYVCDIEANGLTDASRIWCMVWHNVETGASKTLRDYDQMREFLQDPDKALVFHNGICYDKPLLNRLLNMEVESAIIDTLGLSWYLYPTRNRHGLEGWGEEFGVPKPEVLDWDDEELIDTYCHRCEEDVKINTRLWVKMVKDLEQLYGKGKWHHAASHINFMVECLALKQECKWKLNVEKAEDLFKTLEGKAEESKDALNAVMPDVPVYANKTKPKKPYKKDGSLSATGTKWKALVEEHDKDFDYDGVIKVVTKYEPPNSGSHVQIKKWLYSLGWEPLENEYKFDRNKETGEVRKIPQVRNKDTGEIHASLKILAEDHPELLRLNDLGVLLHRKGVVKGLLENADEDGYVYAGASGFTNTLRLTHKICVNIPGVKKPWGEEIRGCLSARDDEHELVGSDMCALEDITKQHYMWKYDPQYVKDMSGPGFDPHCDLAVAAGIMTRKEEAAFKHMKKKELPEVVGKDGDLYVFKVLDKVRSLGKSANYACLVLRDTEVLTVEGWKRYEDLEIGAAVLSYNTEKDVVERDVIKDIHYFEDKEVIKTSNSLVSFESTEEHRWWGFTGGRQSKKFGFFTTGEINTTQSIVCAAPYVGGTSSITPNEAALVARTLASSQDAAEHLNWVSWVVSLPKESLQSFVYHFLNEFEEVPIRIQLNEGNILDAIEVGMNLLGWRTIREGAGKCKVLRVATDYVTDMKKEVLPPEPTFCITTGNGTFIMRQGGFVSITGNCTYGARGPTVARTAGVPLAQGEKIVDAYWARNWSLNAIAKDCKVKQCRKLKWLWNPVAQMWFYLKKEKDRFSTLNQGTGAYCFALWVKEILLKREQLTGDFHDEVILEILTGHREAATNLLKWAIGEVNRKLMLNRELDVDVQFGDTYAAIH